MADKLRIISGDNVISFGNLDFDGEMMISIHNENTGEGRTSWLGVNEVEKLANFLLSKLSDMESAMIINED